MPNTCFNSKAPFLTCVDRASPVTHSNIILKKMQSHWPRSHLVHIPTLFLKKCNPIGQGVTCYIFQHYSKKMQPHWPRSHLVRIPTLFLKNMPSHWPSGHMFTLLTFCGSLNGSDHQANLCRINCPSSKPILHMHAKEHGTSYRQTAFGLPKFTYYIENPMETTEIIRGFDCSGGLSVNYVKYMASAAESTKYLAH